MQNIRENIKTWVIIWMSAWFAFLWIWLLHASIDSIWTNPNNIEASKNWFLSSQDWNKLLWNVKYLNSQLSLINWSPSWIVSAFVTSNCPEWWFPADGTNGTPDLRGIFIRWANTFDNGITYNNRDKDRETSWSWVLTYQLDWMRNITGSFYAFEAYIPAANARWVFKSTQSSASATYHTSWWANRSSTVSFDASWSVGSQYIWSDNRPENVALIYCVKE